jgi:hypothetical protein
LVRTKMMGYGLTERIKEVYSWRWRCGSWLVRQDSEIIAAVRLVVTSFVHVLCPWSLFRVDGNIIGWTQSLACHY